MTSTGSKNLPAIDALVAELLRLPGVGPRSAVNLAYHLVSLPEERVQRLAQAIGTLPRKVRNCSECGNLTEEDPCPICTDPGRDRSLLCVVEDPLDALSIERSRACSGLYHVLGGALSPLDGVGPDRLRIELLLSRLRRGEVREVILATNPSGEGEATAVYLRKAISDLDPSIRMTRFARGLPIGGELAHTDEETLAMAFLGRKAIED